MTITDTEHDDIAPAPERETLPPSPLTEPPAGYDPLPSEALQRLTGYDPDLFLHAALLAAADGAHEARRAHKANADIKGLLEKQTEQIIRETKADIGLVRSSVSGVQQSVDALVTRVGNTEREQQNIAAKLDAGSERFEKLEFDMAAMHSTIDRLDREFAVLKATQDAKKHP